MAEKLPKSLDPSVVPERVKARGVRSLEHLAGGPDICTDSFGPA